MKHILSRNDGEVIQIVNWTQKETQPLQVEFNVTS